jgi:hypothetical protein
MDPTVVEGQWYSEYGHGQNKHVVFYDGIGLDQILANAIGKYALEHSTMDDIISKTFKFSLIFIYQNIFEVLHKTC